MVNRILIRIKVVQMLYSYLLTRSEFKIDTAPETTSKDKKYAYAVYLEFLLLILQLSGIRIRRNDGSMSPEITVDKLIAKNRVGKALYDNDTIKAIILRGSSDTQAFDSILQKLADNIAKSAAYRDYKKIKSPTLADDVRFWLTVVNTVIAKDQEFINLLRENEAFTIAGFEAGVKQISDTLTSYQDSRMTYVNAGKELKASLDKAYELYYSLFVLMMELTREQALRLDNAKSKFLATHEDLNPNTRFVDNRFIARLEANEDLQTYIAEHPVTWADDSSLIRSLLDSILESKIYQDYMEAETDDYAADCDFWRNVMKSIVLPSDDLAEALESKSIYWNDDLPIMGTFVLKTIKQFASSPDKEVKFLPQYKDSEDEDFGPDLFRYAVENRETYRSYIDRFINASQWDPERLAFMDIVVMIAAIAELVNYPAIPVPVTMNEYIEIANSYSTSRSGQFINGILFSVVRYLNEEGIISKN
ncbi:MAG: transcription antitermination protein NusB [Muribaculaceae bacterium]|nr:transcription antitermination protein NusB [Muribaculaceae bacterium]